MTAATQHSGARKLRHGQLKNQAKTRERNGRDVIFKTLFPGVFLYLVVYYAFVHSPATADFYCESLREMIQKQIWG